ncbi:MAG: hypothetical protein QXI58_01900 [Candidatus Micrarchaeia archaeon]
MKKCECGKKARYFVSPGLGTLVFRLKDKGYEIYKILYHRFTPEDADGGYFCAKCLKEHFNLPGERVKFIRRENRREV